MVKVRHRGRLIYFHAGMVPSEEAVEAAFAIAQNVAFRSGDFYSPGSLEKADAVAGEGIPDPYVKAYPVVTSADDFRKVLNPNAEPEPTEPPAALPAEDKDKDKKTKAKDAGQPPASPDVVPVPPPAPPGDAPKWNAQT